MTRPCAQRRVSKPRKSILAELRLSEKIEKRFIDEIRRASIPISSSGSLYVYFYRRVEQNESIANKDFYYDIFVRDPNKKMELIKRQTHFINSLILTKLQHCIILCLLYDCDLKTNANLTKTCFEFARKLHFTKQTSK